MYNAYYAYTISTTEYLDKIFAYLPSNAFINKGRCGIGGTTLELTNRDRCSIIVAPTKGILENKLKGRKDYEPNLFTIDGDTTPKRIEDKLLERCVVQKIMVIPDSFPKLMAAMKKVGMLEEIKESWFLLLDECHTFITEMFRKNILKPFIYFWEFANKAIISATPYHFSDPRMKKLDYYEVSFTESLGKVNIVKCTSVIATLIDLVNKRETVTGNFHIFFNSVKAIADVIRESGLSKCSIYCADDNEKENMRKLGDFKIFFHEHPSSENFSRINFYTCRYFEGCDLLDPNAKVILVTDVHMEHTKISVAMKLKQAAGRIRETVIDGKVASGTSQLIHLTNTLDIPVAKKPLSQFTEQYFEEAKLIKRQHEEYIENCKTGGRVPNPDSRLPKYCDVEDDTLQAEINTYLVDQHINQAYSNEIYNDISFIKDEWQSAGYEVLDGGHSHLKLKTKTTMKRMSKAKQFEQDYRALKTLKEDTNIVFHFGETIEDELRRRNPLVIEAYNLLTEDKLISLKFNIIKVSTEVILASNLHQECMLLKMLNQSFKVGQRYKITHINKVLSNIYTLLNIRDCKGNIKKAEAVQLNEPGRFDTHPCKMDDKKTNGYEIVRKHFNMRIAA